MNFAATFTSTTFRSIFNLPFLFSKSITTLDRLMKTYMGILKLEYSVKTFLHPSLAHYCQGYQAPSMAGYNKYDNSLITQNFFIRDHSSSLLHIFL